MEKNIKNTNGFSFNNLSVALVTLGCDKNRVDAERMIFKLKQIGFSIAVELEKADLILINTCAFIKSAIEETEEMIEKVFDVKKKNAKVVLTGCYTQRFYDEIMTKYPNIDCLVKLSENEKLENIICNLYNVPKIEIAKNNLERVLSTPKHYAFLKISDGCNNHCTYCTIPSIRGKYISVPMEQLLDEAKELCNNGVKELIIVAQDVTRYGIDIYGKPMLCELLQKLSEIDTLRWIRLHYCYPEMVDDNLIEEIVNNDKIVKYIDIPLQHFSDRILKLMNRRGNSELIANLITKLKRNNIKIRSTFIVGFPTENDEDFKCLVNFLKTYKLDFVGFFKYSQEENTPAGKMQQVDEKIKDKRLKKLQKIQTKIIKEKHKKMLKTIVEVVVEGRLQQDIYLARTALNSPEVDTEIYIRCQENLVAGEFYACKLKKMLNFDFEGEIL